MSSSMMSQMFRGGSGSGMYMGLHWGWWLLWAVIVALLVWALARGLSGWGKREAPRSDPDSAEAILRSRFARGEISEEEFREREKVLRES